MRVIILIGLPGAGKSTWIKENTWGDVSICSADHWHEGPNGYEFKIEERPNAHHACLRKFVKLVTASPYMGDPRPLGKEVTVIVDNTNAMVYDLAPYINVARAFGHVPELVYLECPVSLSYARNTHGAPLAIIEHMDRCLKGMLDHWPSIWADIMLTKVPLSLAQDSVSHKDHITAMSIRCTDHGGIGPNASCEICFPVAKQGVVSIRAFKSPNLTCECFLAEQGRCGRTPAGEYMLEGWPDSIVLCERCEAHPHSHIA